MLPSRRTRSLTEADRPAAITCPSLMCRASKLRWVCSTRAFAELSQQPASLAIAGNQLTQRVQRTERDGFLLQLRGQASGTSVALSGRQELVASAPIIRAVHANIKKPTWDNNPANNFTLIRVFTTSYAVPASFVLGNPGLIVERLNKTAQKSHEVRGGLRPEILRY